MQRSHMDMSIKKIVKLAESNKLVFNNAIQRGLVWDKRRKSLLIDSIFRDYPVPDFYANSDNSDKENAFLLDCLDGKQRCNALREFKNNKFSLTNLAPLETEDGLIELNGLTYEMLPEELRDTFDTFIIRVQYLIDATENDIKEIMFRLNNGKSFTSSDIARIKAKDLNGLYYMGQHKIFYLIMTPKSIQNKKYESIIISTYAQLQDINTSLTLSSTQKIYETLSFTPDVELKLQAIYNAMYDIYDAIEDEEDKKMLLRRVYKKKVHFISLTYIADMAISDKRTAADMAECILAFYKCGWMSGDENNATDGPSISEAYNKASVQGTNHSLKVKTRITELINHYNNFFSK